MKIKWIQMIELIREKNRKDFETYFSFSKFHSYKTSFSDVHFNYFYSRFSLLGTMNVDSSNEKHFIFVSLDCRFRWTDWRVSSKFSSGSCRTYNSGNFFPHRSEEPRSGRLNGEDIPLASSDFVAIFSLLSFHFFFYCFALEINFEDGGFCRLLTQFIAGRNK